MRVNTKSCVGFRLVNISHFEHVVFRLKPTICGPFLFSHPEHIDAALRHSLRHPQATNISTPPKRKNSMYQTRTSISKSPIASWRAKVELAPTLTKGQMNANYMTPALVIGRNRINSGMALKSGLNVQEKPTNCGPKAADVLANL